MKSSLRIRMLQKDTWYWRWATAGLYVADAVWLVLLALGMPTGIGTGFDIAVILLAHTAGMLLIALAIALLLTLLRFPWPNFFAGSLLYSVAVIYTIMYNPVDYDLLASSILTAGNVLLGIGFGVFAGFVCDRTFRAKTRLISIAVVCCLVAGVMLRPIDLIRAEVHNEEDDRTEYNAAKVGMVNPGLPGRYSYTAFTYGSGNDKHRSEFGENSTLVSNTVDASDYITDWPNWRTMFWGFDEKELPLNGRVWMPQGSGPFPLVLIVHGNHTMEKFSDDGYAYLGEQLASRGMIAVSVDQNFINYSHWSGIPNDNYKLRTWVLLQHINQIDQFNEQLGNPFFSKVDMHNIAIVGHSRGGQAAAMAADPSRWFADDASLPDWSRYEIQAVVAVAPTDVNVDKKAARLQDVYYLTLYGGRDADVNTLKGDEQYSRTTYTDPKRFKAALFIQDANHSYFNSSWGPHDVELPRGALLNQRDTLAREEQQSVAKLYISAFLEIVFHDQREYVGIFRDYRNALEWLPETRYASRFESGAFKPLTDFEHRAARTETIDGSAVEAAGFKEWDVVTVTDKNGASKGTKGAALEWEGEAQLTLELSEQYQIRALEEEDTILTFSIMNAEHELELAPEMEEPSDEPEIIVELESEDGVSVSVPLSGYADIEPMEETSYTVVPPLEDRLRNGKYENNLTPVFQTVEIPLEDLQEIEESLDPEEIERITFYFDNGPARIILDDIGFVQEDEMMK